MSVELASGYVSLIPSAKNVGSQIAKEMGAPIESAAQQTSSRVGGIFTKVAALVGGAFAVKAGVDMFRGFIDAAEDSRRVGAQTAAAIKSTGGAAQVTAKQVGSLADAIAAKTGVDDEAIASGENLLLTFTNIQNRAGKGNDIFNQSTQVLVDMAAAMGGDVSSNAIQLGKALNDPVAGISALTRVGVTFTDQQKAQIKQMVAVGDVAGAQKIILGELNKEFGGSAAAQATAGKKLSVIWGNLQERLGGALLPIVDKAASWFGARLPGAIDKTAAVLGPLAQKAGLLAQAFAAAFSGEGITEGHGIFNVVERLGVGLRTVTIAVQQFFHSLITGFSFDEGTPIERFALTLRDILLPAMQVVTSWVQDHMTVSLIGLGVAVALLIGPVVGTIAALAALTGGVIYAYNHFETFQKIVDAVVGFFRSVLIPGIGAVVGYITDQIGHLATWWRANWDDIQKATENVLKAIVVIAAVAIAPFIFIWKHAHDEILAIVTVVWQQIRNVVDTYIRIVRDIITVVVALLSGDWGKAWDAIKDVPVAVFSFLVDLVKNAVQLLWHIVKAELDVLLGVFSAAWDGIKGGVQAGIRFVVDGFLGMVGMIIDAAARAFGWVPGIGGKLRDAAKDFDRFRDDVNAALGGIKDKIINVSIRGIERHIDPNVGGSFDDGGTVPGPAGKPQLIVAHGGEFVLSRAMLASIQASPAAMPLAGGASRLYQVNMEGAFDGPREISRQVVDNLRRLELLEVA